MKKIVALTIILYVLAMGTMVIWGFFDKNNKEEQLDSNQTLSPASTMQTPPMTNNQEQANKISLSEVKKHNSPNDCWIIVNDKVYNVTNYLKLHPGGEDLLTAQCGNNATTAFSNQGGRGTGHS